MPSPSPARSVVPARPTGAIHRPRDRGGRVGGRRPMREPCRPCPTDAETPVVEVSHTSDPAHGDVASSVALKLARPLRRPPMAIAEAIAAELRDGHRCGQSTRRRPGRGPRLPQHAPRPGVPGAAPSMKRGQPAPTSVAVRQETPRRLNVEFVSANPTGPLTVGNARGAFVGDLLCRVLEAAGDDVTREYYFNDSGRTGAGPGWLGRRADGRAMSCRRRRTRGAYVDDLADGAAGRRSGRRRRHADADRDCDRRCLGIGAHPGGHRGQSRASRCPLRCLEERDDAPHGGLGRARRRTPTDRRLRVRAGRRDLVPVHRLRRRQGPRHLPHER